MSLKQLKMLVETAPVYKMSLGKKARYRTEALATGALVFQSERDLYNAVISGSPTEIAAAARKVRTDRYPNADAPENAWAVWVRTIETFRGLPEGSLILHWESDQDRLHWGVVGAAPFYEARVERNEFAQDGYVFHRGLRDGWHTNSAHGVPISNIHPYARPLAINMATLNFVQTDADYFRALILDNSTEPWTNRPEWRARAQVEGWHPKATEQLRAQRRAREVTADIVEAASDVFEEVELFAEIARMADTAIRTAAYANGQTQFRIVKAKDIGFTREELEDEIASLLKGQRGRCALTDFVFRHGEINPHLKLSLDRKDSTLGYIPGNLQVVTRAANFYKSASDQADWMLKEDALYQMALAIHRRQKAESESG